MRRTIGIFVLAMACALPAFADFDASGGCKDQYIQPTTTNVYITSGNQQAVTLYPQGESVTVRLYTCKQANVAQCQVYTWEVAGVTRNTLDGNGATRTRGVTVPAVKTIRVEVVSPPSAENTVVIGSCPTPGV